MCPQRSRPVSAALRRSPALLRLVLTYGIFGIGEFGSWILVMVYAYQRGGTTEAGLMVVAQLIPAAAFAPVAGRLAERTSPASVLVGGFGAQAAGMFVAGAGVLMDQPVVAYGGAILAATAMVTTRPAQTALLPGLVTSGEGLVAANVALGRAENLADVLAGVFAGLLLFLWGVGGGLIALGLLVLTAVPLNLAAHRAAKRSRGQSVGPGHADAEPGERLLRNPAARMLFALLGTEWVIIGALDVLTVVLAIDLLGAGENWAGFLQTAEGLGGLVASIVAVAFVGRRLGGIAVGLALLLGVFLALTSVVDHVSVAVVLLVGVGLCRVLLDISARILLQRTVQPHLLARLFGTLEGVSQLGLALGALLVSVASYLGGERAAFLVIGALMPVVVLVFSRSLMRLDANADVPVVEIALLRRMRMFSSLPPPELEGVARALVHEEFEPGDVLIREGEPGDCYFAIADGEVGITRQGESLGLRHAGDGVGEIALVRNVPRTATVTAASAVTAYRLDRDSFLEAVLESPATHEAVEHIVDERLRDEDPARESDA